MNPQPPKGHLISNGLKPSSNGYAMASPSSTIYRLRKGLRWLCLASSWGPARERKCAQKLTVEVTVNRSRKLEAWPDLPDTVKAGILAMVRGCEG